jgi:hypothetical protein
MLSACFIGRVREERNKDVLDDLGITSNRSIGSQSTDAKCNEYSKYSDTGNDSICRGSNEWILSINKIRRMDRYLVFKCGMGIYL